MKRLFVQPRGEKITIDQGVYGRYDTPVPVSMVLRQEWLGSDLLGFWRFSFQYGLEMTDHQRLKWPTDADREDMLDRRSSGSSFLPKTGNTASLLYTGEGVPSTSYRRHVICNRGATFP
jgi:hypothetical protein